MQATSTFVGGFSSGAAVGVASLDPPLIQHTQSEIRNLAGEIAKLAHSNLTPADFYAGLLPRLCMAMGATAAAVWQTHRSRGLQTNVPIEDQGLEPQLFLTADHGMPPLLIHEQAATQAHERILRCVVAEGQPMLVPPGKTHVETLRPSNPSEDSLIIVPVRIQEEVEYVLEVVQRPSGGPAAQRGYLRFVAQIADLMSDYLRRQLLRESSARTAKTLKFEHWIGQIAQASGAKDQLRLVADSLVDMLECHQSFIVQSRRAKVTAVSGLGKFDARSESVLAVEAVERAIRHSYAASTIPATLSLARDETGETAPQVRPLLSKLCQLVAAHTMLRIQLSPYTQRAIWIASDHPIDAEQQATALRMSNAFGALLSDHRGATWSSLSLSPTQPKRTWWQRWVMRIALLTLLAIIALFPVPQQVTTTGVLAPVKKRSYYAPSNAIVEEVLVTENQEVNIGQPLLRLNDRNLQSEIDRLMGLEQTDQKRASQLEGQRLRDGQLTQQQRDQLDSELAQLQVSLKGSREQIELLQKQASQLNVIADVPGKLATWDLHNRLLNRPVTTGDLLLSTFEEDGPWQLQVSVPEHRTGLVAEAIEASEFGAVVRFSLTSHPQEMREGRLIRLADQTTRRTDSSNVVLGTGLIESQTLPIKKEGAIARVTIDCGQVPALWLLTRDAYNTCAGFLKMIW